jgi:uncharacterized protein
METLFHKGVIQTYSGLPYDFANPDPDCISLRDIAHALANACRFAGHTKRFYSVAEHSVRVSLILEAWGLAAPVPRDGLMHDGHEAYVWDCPRPFKPLLGNVYEEFADKADAAIGAHFGFVPADLKADIIKQADDCALVAEANILMCYNGEAWEDWPKKYSKVPPPPKGTFVEQAVGWSPQLAEEEFLARAKEVGIG